MGHKADPPSSDGQLNQGSSAGRADFFAFLPLLLVSLGVGAFAYWAVVQASPIDALGRLLVVPADNVDEGLRAEVANLQRRYTFTLGLVTGGGAFASTLLALGTFVSPERWSRGQTRIASLMSLLIVVCPILFVLARGSSAEAAGWASAAIATLFACWLATRTTVPNVESGSPPEKPTKPAEMS